MKKRKSQQARPHSRTSRQARPPAAREPEYESSQNELAVEEQETPPPGQPVSEESELQLVVAEPKANQYPGLGCLLRLYWMFFGNMIACLCLFHTVLSHTPSLAASIIFWLAVAGLLVARYLEISYLGGKTALGEPVGMREFRSYALRAVGLWAMAFVAAHVLTRFVAI